MRLIRALAAWALFFLIFAEFSARLLTGTPLLSLSNVPADKNNLLFNMAAFNRYDETLGWTLKDNLSMVGMTTGAYGVRMNDDAIKPLPRDAIVAVGDSFTFGSEVGSSESWPAQLERISGQPVINGGEGGYASDQIVLRAEQLLQPLRPKTVVVALVADDIERANYRIWSGAGKPWFSTEDRALKLNNVPVAIFSGSVSDIGWKRSIAGRLALAAIIAKGLYGPAWWANEQTSAHVPNDDALVSCVLLQRLKGETDAAGARLLLVFQYGGDQILSWAMQSAPLARVAMCLGGAVETLDTWGLLKEASANRVDFDRLYVMHGAAHGHMSVEGNGLIAKLIAERLAIPRPGLSASRQ